MAQAAIELREIRAMDPRVIRAMPGLIGFTVPRFTSREADFAACRCDAHPRPFMTEKGNIRRNLLIYVMLLNTDAEDRRET
jgi:hypothetical protein